MSNANYQGINGSGAGKNLAGAVEALLSKDKILIAAKTRYPLLARLLEGETACNYSNEGAPKYLLPVSFGVGPGSGTTGFGAIQVGSANGVTGRAFTPAANMTAIPLSFNDSTFAEERESFYVTGFGLTYQEEKTLENGSTQKRISAVKARSAEIKDWYLKRLATDLATATTASETKILGLGWAIATANVVHGIDQAATSNWTATVQASIGAWTIADIDEQVRLQNQNRDANVDLIVFSTSASSNRNWQKMMTFYRNATVIMNHQATAKMGSNVYMWNNAELMYDQFLPNNDIWFLDSSKLYWNGDKNPQIIESGNQIPTTTAKATTFGMRACVMTYPQFHKKMTRATA